MKTCGERERAKENIKVSAEVKTILCDLFNQIQYELIEQYEEFREENEILTNNWNELEEWLKDMKPPKQDNWGDYGYTWALKIDVILDKMKEIKEGNDGYRRF